MKPSSPRRCTAAWLVAALLLFAGVSTVMTHRAIEAGFFIDGEVYWTAANQPGTAAIYELRVTSYELPFTYPPLAWLLLQPLRLLTLPEAMAALTVALVPASLLLAWSALRQQPRVRAAARPMRAALYLSAAAFLQLSAPVAIGANLANISTFIVLLVLLPFLLPAGHARSIALGVAVGLAAGIKLTPALLVLAFLMRRDWSALAASLATGLGGLAVSFLLLPDAFIRYWFTELWAIDRVGVLWAPGNVSIRGALSRLPLDAGVQSALWLLTSAAIVAALLWLTGAASAQPGRRGLTAASAAQPHAERVQPDARQARPDAGPALPDAVRARVDAGYAWPDTEQAQPDARQAQPDAARAHADAAPVRPGATQVLTDTDRTRSGAKRPGRDVAQALPDAAILCLWGLASLLISPVTWEHHATWVPVLLLIGSVTPWLRGSERAVVLASSALLAAGLLWRGILTGPDFRAFFERWLGPAGPPYWLPPLVMLAMLAACCCWARWRAGRSHATIEA